MAKRLERTRRLPRAPAIAGERPLDPVLVELVEALADATALRDHRAMMAARHPRPEATTRE